MKIFLWISEAHWKEENNLFLYQDDEINFNDHFFINKIFEKSKNLNLYSTEKIYQMDEVEVQKWMDDFLQILKNEDENISQISNKISELVLLMQKYPNQRKINSKTIKQEFFFAIAYFYSIIIINSN